MTAEAIRVSMPFIEFAVFVAGAFALGFLIGWWTAGSRR